MEMISYVVKFYCMLVVHGLVQVEVENRTKLNQKSMN